MAEAPRSGQPTGGRRGSVWPWLIMPVIALGAFFALRSWHAGMNRQAAPAAAAPQPEQADERFRERQSDR